MASKSSAITLYRSILRSHAKSLPVEMRSLGDAYVKSEFRLHKNVNNEEQLGKFFTEWEQYLKHIQETARAKETKAAGLTDSQQKADYGVELDADTSVGMTEEQKVQLEKLRHEASKVNSGS
jgi:hypothetical protein